MRAGFRDIISGWMLVDDFDQLTDRIERSAEWAKANGPLEPDEEATARMMIEAQVACGIRRGDFDFPAGDGEPAPLPDFGPCCMCERTGDVRNIILLTRRCVIAGHGWGCVACGVPMDGAYAVLCDRCLDVYQADNSLLTLACRGYPASEGRIAIDVLPAGFDHDMTKHPEEGRG